MQKVIQQRVGHSGTCFRASLASVLNLREQQVPDFPEANCDAGVDEFLKPRGLKYEEYPITDPAPSGYHFILGTSPRGGQHCVVGLNGKLAHDPHPQDGTRRGLVEPKSWGVLEPLGGQDRMTVSPVDGSLRYGDGGFKQWAAKRNGVAKDALSGKRLNAAAERLYEKHDEIKNNPARNNGSNASMYRATHQLIVSLVKEAEALLSTCRLDDDPAYWRAKLQKAKDDLKLAEQMARSDNYAKAITLQEGAFTLAHTVIDKMRNSGRTRGRDEMTRSLSVFEKHQLRIALETIKNPSKALLGPPSVEEAKEIVYRLTGRKSREAQDSTTNSRRARLHRALDRVMDELPVEITSKKVALQRYNSAERAYSEAGRLYNGKIPPHIKEWMERAKKELAAAKDEAPRPGMLGVNADKAKSLHAGLERKGFRYSHPMKPHKDGDKMVRHVYSRREDDPEMSTLKTLNERINGYHNVTDM